MPCTASLPAFALTCCVAFCSHAHCVSCVPKPPANGHPQHDDAAPQQHGDAADRARAHQDDAAQGQGAASRSRQNGDARKERWVQPINARLPETSQVSGGGVLLAPSLLLTHTHAAACMPRRTGVPRQATSTTDDSRRRMCATKRWSQSCLRSSLRDTGASRAAKGCTCGCVHLFYVCHSRDHGWPILTLAAPLLSRLRLTLRFVMQGPPGRVHPRHQGGVQDGRQRTDGHHRVCGQGGRDSARATSRERGSERGSVAGGARGRTIAQGARRATFGIHAQLYPTHHRPAPAELFLTSERELPLWCSYVGRGGRHLLRASWLAGYTACGPLTATRWRGAVGSRGALSEQATHRHKACAHAL